MAEGVCGSQRKKVEWDKNLWAALLGWFIFLSLCTAVSACARNFCLCIMVYCAYPIPFVLSMLHQMLGSCLFWFSPNSLFFSCTNCCAAAPIFPLLCSTKFRLCTSAPNFPFAVQHQISLSVQHQISLVLSSTKFSFAMQLQFSLVHCCPNFRLLCSTKFLLCCAAPNS